MSPRKKLFLGIVLPRLGEVFSAASSGQGAQVGNPEVFPGEDPDPEPPVIHGIQTQEGQDIEEQGGDIIQAETQ